MQRSVTLPVYVTEEDSEASFRNKVLEVRFKKAVCAEQSRIETECSFPFL